MKSETLDGLNRREIQGQTIAKIRSGRVTKETVSTYWTAALGRILECDWSDEAIAQPLIDIRGNAVPSFMVPLITSASLPDLGGMYPEMGSHATKEGAPITHAYHPVSPIEWVQVPFAQDAANLDTSREEAEAFAQGAEYSLGQFEEYVRGAHALYDMNKTLFDQGRTWSILPGTFDSGMPVRANFRPDGSLDINVFPFPTRHGPRMGVFIVKRKAVNI